MYVDFTALSRTTQALIASAGNYRRMRRAVENGARLIREERCEFVDEETIRVHSDSGETYLTSLADCVNEATGETCPAFSFGVPCKHRASLHILLKLSNEDEDGEHRCDECGRRFRIERLIPVDRSVLEPGGMVPSGECPVCGFYCYPYEGEAEEAAAA